MKIFYYPILFTLMLHTFVGKAQNFAPIGAKWTYKYIQGTIQPPPYLVVPVTIEITKDTLINGLECREALIAISGDVQTKKYVRNVNDRFLVYSPVNNEFNLLYDFNVTVGDTLKIFSSAPFSQDFLDSSYVIIDSLGTKNIKGVNYRAYHQTCLNNLGSCFDGEDGWVIDSLGIVSRYYEYPFVDKISYLFLSALNVGPTYIFPLRCYSDTNTRYNYSNSACDTSYIITQIKDVKNGSLTIYPTVLSKDNYTIFIDNPSPNKIKNVELFGMQGKRLRVKIQHQLKRCQVTIEQKGLPGIYFLQVQFQQTVIIKKIIVL
jgi:hypothetical protein